MTHDNSISRRNFFKRIFTLATIGGTFSLIGASLVDVWLAAGRFSSDRWIHLADADSIPEDGTFPFPEKEIALIKKSGQLAAISLSCTHLGCLLNVMEQGFFCPCHGSEFGPTGQVYTGPANRDLPWHDIRMANGKIHVHSGKKLAAPVWVEERHLDPTEKLG